jgi:DNA-binding MarR family transcriptional regulator
MSVVHAERTARAAKQANRSFIETSITGRVDLRERARRVTFRHRQVGLPPAAGPTSAEDVGAAWDEFGMNVWMDLKRALTVMDYATRSWGRELGLDECGVMVLSLLGEEGRALEWQLGMKCGRARQQVHRSLCLMKKRGLVKPDVSERGRNKPWALTEKGQKLWECLSRGIREWQGLLEERIDVAQLKSELQQIVTIFLNRPRADGGWRRALCVPPELLKMPMRVEAEAEGLLVSETEAPELGTPIVTEDEDWLPASPGLWGPPEEWTPAEREFLKFCRELEREKAMENNRSEAAPVGSDS